MWVGFKEQEVLQQRSLQILAIIDKRRPAPGKSESDEHHWKC